MRPRITDLAYSVLIEAREALTAKEIAKRIGHGISSKSVAVGCTFAGHPRIKTELHRNAPNRYYVAEMRP